MPAPEYGNNGAEGPEPENDPNKSLSGSPVDLPQNEPDESVREIVDRFVKQDRKLGHGIERLHHSEPYSKPATELIEKERLNEILEHARREDIPYKLLGYLWELGDADPEMIKEPPLVREHALSDVIRPMWEQRLEYELESYLLCELEGYENEHGVEEPQPQEEIDAPQNLYQLVRKAWDQNRMEELLAMIEENDDALLGVTLKEAVALHRGTSL
jgi:hypothetical protein